MAQDLTANAKCSLLVTRDPEDRTDLVITLHGDATPVSDMFVVDASILSLSLSLYIYMSVRAHTPYKYLYGFKGCYLDNNTKTILFNYLGL